MWLCPYYLNHFHGHQQYPSSLIQRQQLARNSNEASTVFGTDENLIKWVISMFKSISITNCSQTIQLFPIFDHRKDTKDIFFEIIFPFYHCLRLILRSFVYHKLLKRLKAIALSLIPLIRPLVPWSPPLSNDSNIVLWLYQ